MAKLFANRGDLDQMPQNVASDLGLHCLPITLLGVSRRKKGLISLFECVQYSQGSVLLEFIAHNL